MLHRWRGWALALASPLIAVAADAGMHTDAQVARGERAYLEHCAACHQASLQGNGPAPELAGESFLARWQGRSGAELFERIRSTMPMGQPRSLSDQTYLDIVALMLAANALADESTELTGQNDLEAIRLVSKSTAAAIPADAVAAPAFPRDSAVAPGAARSARKAPTGAGRGWQRPPGADWPMIGGDWGNTRYSKLAQINISTIDKLGGAWVRQFDRETSRATPVIAGGLMLLTAGAHVYALDAKTGVVVWKYRPQAPPNNLFKGVAIGEGLIFVGLSDARVIALRLQTGELVWSRLVGDERPPRQDLQQFNYVGAPPAGQYISAAPAYARGRVIVGLVNGDYGVRGRVVALDAKTGGQVWRFDTVPGPGEFGHDTWPKDSEVWKTGGAGVWMTPAVDADLGLVLFATGNPMPALGGELRPGDNLFANSAVALDLRTGKRRWHYQLVRHDLWEADLGTPLILYDARIGGRARQAVAVMRTDGYLFLLDRRTGEPLLPVEERSVKQNARLRTAATQPFPMDADALTPQCVTADLVPTGFQLACHYDPIDVDLPNVMLPKFAARAAPMAHDPGSGYFYVTGTVASAWFKRFDDPYFLSLGQAPGQKSYGVFAAIDSRTNRIVWRKRMQYPLGNGSGVLATKGGLLFHGEPDGHLQAHDARTGELRWQFQTGFAADGPAATYEIDGEQYVAAVTTRAVWSFKLDGTVSPLPAPTPPPTESAFAGRVEETDRIAIGATVSDMGLNGVRRAFDEHIITPVRARVKAGTRVVWTNQGQLVHAVRAIDDSWRSGRIAPGASAEVSFERRGTYIYVCDEHPWVYAQLVVD